MVAHLHTHISFSVPSRMVLVHFLMKLNPQASFDFEIVLHTDSSILQTQQRVFTKILQEFYNELRFSRALNNNNENSYE